MQNMRGRFIVFEGISGTGKETQARLLKDALEEKGISATLVFHPTPDLKELLHTWRKSRAIDTVAEVYFLLADRSDRVRQVIAPALAVGQWVISLRSSVSALVYQGATDEARTWINAEFSRFEPPADALFFFDITPEEAIVRIQKRHEKTGEPLGKFETQELLSEKRHAYRTVLRSLDHISIDASQEIPRIHEQIIGRLAHLL
ncbi:MAG: dTMP kinase [bacterium]|nr:dTMP kinase [bacterium]